MEVNIMEKPYWEGKHYSYFSNKECEYFPCHKGADPENFNCLFCYCPLYALGDKCGGNFKFTDKGFKDCTDCQRPHKVRNGDAYGETPPVRMTFAHRGVAPERRP